jgi:GNAT superfamily N-acetyltransferase
MLNIRPAIPEDVPVILELIRALADYEHEPQAARATAADLLRDGWGPEPKFRCLIADWKAEGEAIAPASATASSATDSDWRPAGFALYFYNYSTWRGRCGIYLEDLFVRPEYRRRGIGRALLVYLARLAWQEQCGRFEWQVLDWNTPAIQFYESLGARMMPAWRTMRVEGEAIGRLAEWGAQAAK